jgi:acetylglutamate kinase
MERTLSLLDAVPYLRAYSGQTFVVKLGGDLIADRAALDTIARDLAVLHRLRIAVVVVHGGGPQLDAVLKRLSLPIERVAGRRITTLPVLDVAKMVFRGQLSLEVVSAIARAGERAVGLSGADGALVLAQRRAPQDVKDDDGITRRVDWGEVGDIVAVQPSILRAVLSDGAIPIVGPLAADTDGNVLNVNADTIAARIAVALSAAKLVLLTQVPGVLEDKANPSSLLHWTDLEELAELEAKGAIQGGMRPKVAAVRSALQGGVPRVHIIDGRRDGALLEEVFTTDGCGTLVVQEADEAPAEPLQ